MEGPVAPGGGTNLAAGKKTKEQLELIRQENAHAAKINKLMVQYHMAVGIEDWLNAISLVKQLIVLDPTAGSSTRIWERFNPTRCNTRKRRRASPKEWK